MAKVGEIIVKFDKQGTSMSIEKVLNVSGRSVDSQTTYLTKDQAITVSRAIRAKFGD